MRVGVWVGAGVAAGLLATLGAAQDAAAPVLWSPPKDPSEFAAGWRFSDPRAFRVEFGFDASGRVVDPRLVLTSGGEYAPRVRSPQQIALWDPVVFADFVLDVEMQQTGREYGHRDLCVFFGHRAHDRYYYVHLASRADPHAHNVFVVDGAPRRAIAAETTAGIDWGEPDDWHPVRVERRGASIRVYFDDLETPIMIAEDATHAAGRIGLGSFDDEGRFRNLRIRGVPRSARETLGALEPFHRPR